MVVETGFYQGALLVTICVWEVAVIEATVLQCSTCKIYLTKTNIFLYRLTRNLLKPELFVFNSEREIIILLKDEQQI